MNTEWWVAAWNDQAGYSHGYYAKPHSSVCGCELCLAMYDNHQGGWQECVCFPCEQHNIARNDPFKTDEKGVPIVATVNFCDRCPSMGKSIVMGSITFRTDPSKRDKTIEICPGCVGDFMEWMMSDIMSIRENGYKTPWKKDVESDSTILVKKEARQMIRELLAGDDDDAA